MSAIEIPDQLTAAAFVRPATTKWVGVGVVAVKINGVGDYEITFEEEICTEVASGSDFIGQDYLMVSAWGVTDVTIVAEQTDPDKRKVDVHIFLAGAAANRDFSIEVRRMSGSPLKYNATV